jgi:hypothetical protein
LSAGKERVRLRSTAAILVCLHATVAHAACDPSSRDSRYDIKGDTVLDEVSHLLWQRCSVGQQWKDGSGCTGAVKPLTWVDAKQEQSGGWRLPTRDELVSLVSKACAKPTIDSAAFPGMEADSLNYWTATAVSDSSVYYVNFANGVASADAIDEPYAVRLVRSGK